MNLNNNELVIKLASKIKPFQIKLEIITIFLFLISFIFIEINPQISSILRVLSLSFLAVIEFFLAHYKTEDSNPLKLFSNKLLQLSFAVSIIGVLFTIQCWPGYNPMLMVGFSSILIGIIGYTFTYYKDHNVFNFSNLNYLRVLILFFALAFLYFNGNIKQAKEIENKRHNIEAVE